MLESKSIVRPILGVALLLWGMSSQAWATYGGGACYSCAPALDARAVVKERAPAVLIRGDDEARAALVLK